MEYDVTLRMKGTYRVGEEKGREGLEKLAHVIMESEKSHDLPSSSWRLKKDNGSFSLSVKA